MTQVYRSTPVDLRGVQYVHVEFAKSRVFVTRAELRLGDDLRELSTSVRPVYSDATSQIFELVRLSPERHRSIELRFDVAYGRAIPAAVRLYRRLDDPREADQRPADAAAVVVPDWIAGRETFIDRFGRTGHSLRKAFEVPLEFVWFKGAFSEIVTEIRELSLGLGKFDADAARAEALEALCSIAHYFRRLEYLTTEPGASDPGAVPVTVLDELRRALQARLFERAAHAASDKHYVYVPGLNPDGSLDSSAQDLKDRIELVTALFEDAESLLPASVPGASPFEWAYELFVSGRLAAAHPKSSDHWRIMHHGAPDGVPFVLFAKLASTAITLDARADFWGDRLPALVRAAVLFQAHPASAAESAEERLAPGATSDDQYAFFDGKTIPLRVVFELRKRHQQHLAGKSAEVQRDQLERALTWVVGELVETGSTVATGVHGPLNVPLLLLVPPPPLAP
jgi:hypothetical protein